MEEDYPRWTEYSHGNPDCWRRIYCGRLFYVIPDRDGWTWHDANAKPFAVWGPYDTKADAMAAAEDEAERLAGGEQGTAKP